MVPKCSANIGSGQSRRSSTSTSKAGWALARSMTQGVTRSAALAGRVLPMMTCSFNTGLLVSDVVAGVELVGGDGAELPGLVVLDRLVDLLAAVHDERAVVHDRLPEGQAAEHEDLERPGAAGLSVGGAQHDVV